MSSRKVGEWIAGDPSPSPSGGRTTNKKMVLFNSLSVSEIPRKRKNSPHTNFQGKMKRPASTPLSPYPKPDQITVRVNPNQP